MAVAGKLRPQYTANNQNKNAPGGGNTLNNIVNRPMMQYDDSIGDNFEGDQQIEYNNQQSDQLQPNNFSNNAEDITGGQNIEENVENANADGDGFDQYGGESLDEGNSEANQEVDGEGEGEGNADGEEEGESVYMIDGVVMRMIQIEGEENQYLMDPEGRIYDMQANFIGTANTQGLEEMAPDDSQQVQTENDDENQ